MCVQEAPVVATMEYWQPVRCREYEMRTSVCWLPETSLTVSINYLFRLCPMCMQPLGLSALHHSIPNPSPGKHHNALTLDPCLPSSTGPKYPLETHWTDQTLSD